MFIQGFLNPVSKKVNTKCLLGSCLCQHVKERREKKKLPQSISFLDYGSKGTVIFSPLPGTYLIRVPGTLCAND